MSKQGGAETFANYAIVAVCILLAVFIVWRLVADGSNSSGTTQNTYIVGERVGPIVGLNRDAAPRTLLIALRSTCQFCTASMDFYKRLAEQRSPSGIRIVAISSEPIAITEAYAKEHGASFDAVLSFQPGNVKIQRVPTLLVIDSEGSVRNVWEGQLTAEQEQEVIAVVSGAGNAR